nr:hypothetical protein [Tanacetum cinerariifolium]
MPTKVELTLEQLQQGVSDDVLEEYDTHDPKGHIPTILPFLKRRLKINEIVVAHDILLGLAQSAVYVAFKTKCFLNICHGEVIRSLLFKNNDSLITVYVYASDSYSSLKCRTTLIEYVISCYSSHILLEILQVIQRCQLDASFALFESEFLKWLDFVKFDVRNSELIEVSNLLEFPLFVLVVYEDDDSRLFAYTIIYFIVELPFGLDLSKLAIILNRRKARTTLLMALPEDHLVVFHKMADAKEMWEAIKSRFSGNGEFKKMQKYVLKQQFEGFSVSSSEGLHKGYDRFQTLLSQLEIYGAGVSHEDANQNFDDLYNNLRVFERDVKGTTTSSSNTQNVALESAENTSSTNDVSTAYSVSSPSVSNSQKEGSSSYTDEVIHSFFANQIGVPQLDYDDLEQINDDDMEKMDLKWRVAMISMRIKRFHKRTGRKLQFDTKNPVGFDKTKVKCLNCYKIRHFGRDCKAKGNQDSRRRDAGYNGKKTRDNGRRPAYQDDSKALVTIDGEDID